MLGLRRADGSLLLLIFLLLAGVGDVDSQSQPAGGAGDRDTLLAVKKDWGMIILLSVLAGMVLVGSVGIAWLLFRRRKAERHEVTDWKMTAFTQLNFTECDVLRNIREDNVIGSGGSAAVFRVHVVTRGRDVEEGSMGGSVPVAVKRIR